MSLSLEKLVSCFFLAWSYTLVSSTSGNNVKCGGNIHALHGHFNTPEYPNIYPDSVNCKWNITVPIGYEISLNFTQFDIEWTDFCEYDYVTVKSTNGTIGKYCGRRGHQEFGAAIPPLEPIMIKDSNLEIYFHTDHNNEVEVHGFEAHFAATDIDECQYSNGGCSHFCHNFIGSYYCSCRIGYRLAKDGRSCIVVCQNIFVNKEHGVIESPEYPANYPPHASCDWHITADSGYYVNLEFVDFNLETHHSSKCPYDQLAIEDKGGKYGPYCEQKPRKFRSKSNWLIVEFSSDASNSREDEVKRFKAKFWLEGIKCPVLYPPEDGSLSGAKNFSFKEEILFTCNEGYRLVGGSQSRTCQSDGTWTGTTPKCERITCDYFPQTHENIILRGDRTFPPNTRAIYYYKDRLTQSCFPFYDQFGPKHIECKVDGEWSRGRAYCVKTCGRAYPQGNNEKLQKCNEGRHRAKAIPYSQPWLVVIKENGQVKCSGILISDQFVLTVAHCIQNTLERRGEKGTLEIVLGVQDLNTMATSRKLQRRSVKKVHMASKFDYVLHSDISILELSAKVSVHERYVQPICLAHEKRQKHLFKSGHNVVSTGWLTSGQKYITDRCVRIESKENCGSFTNHIHISHFATRYKDESQNRKRLAPVDILCTTPPKGDSDKCKLLPGSGLVAYDDKTRKWYLGGVLTWGGLDLKTCTDIMKKYSMYTKVPKFLKWIKETTDLRIKDLDATADKFRNGKYAKEKQYV
ncbi:mannan-binding lectin serine protease 1-like [Hydractinia symbiolongicarpus]|uniref:mannan-binding lectin serine protease 1-like n=1 Tax=Hydractinia symbiolongicarpus TaxID=13093 RepID=UPI00254EF34D|nr:mannan-binding lectin serine protease 1-like [Hydractinia symbiolongicarpus]